MWWRCEDHREAGKATKCPGNVLQRIVGQVQLFKTLELFQTLREPGDLVVGQVHLPQLVQEADGGGQLEQVVVRYIQLFQVQKAKNGVREGR